MIRNPSENAAPPFAWDDAVAVVAGPIDRAAITSAFAQGKRAVAEAGTMDHPSGPHFVDHLNRGGLGLALSTRTAYGFDVAGVFVSLLLGRFHPGPGTRDEAVLAVHEAVANALVHGNLGVPTLAETREGFESHCDALDRALADPVLMARRLELSAAPMEGGFEIAVTDQGNGYARVSRTEGTRRVQGLDLISQSTICRRVEDCGRCLILVVETAEADR